VADVTQDSSLQQMIPYASTMLMHADNGRVYHLRRGVMSPSELTHDLEWLAASPSDKYTARPQIFTA
jgi:hypothetical protein